MASATIGQDQTRGRTVDFVLKDQGKPVEVVYPAEGSPLIIVPSGIFRGAPNPNQWDAYAKNNCVFQYHMPETMHYMRNWNREYLDFAKEKGWRQKNDPVQLALYSDTLQSFRLAAQGKAKGRQPPDDLRRRAGRRSRLAAACAGRRRDPGSGRCRTGRCRA